MYLRSPLLLRNTITPRFATASAVLFLVASLAGDSANSARAEEATAKPMANAPRPPYQGTIHVAPDIYLDSDPSSFGSLKFIGRGTCQMFDRRADRLVTNNAHRFKADFNDGLSLEVRVNPEFSRERGEELAVQYMRAFGQLPTELRREMKDFDIHDGDMPFGGGGRNVLVHIGMGERYLKNGILTETLFHETVHATIDDLYRNDPAWLAAQQADPTFVSTYARDNPNREDLAETLLLCIAMAERPERLPAGMVETLRATIPKRQAFFEQRLAWRIVPRELPAGEPREPGAGQG